MNRTRALIASCFGIGYVPIAPGTAASLAVALAYRYVLSSLAWPVLVGLCALLFFLGVWASGGWAKDLGRRDPKVIVVDEVCGQLLVLLFVSPSWIPVLVGFGLFRAADILKPYPVSKTEDLKGGWGIMADDLAAAILAKVVLHLYLLLK